MIIEVEKGYYKQFYQFLSEVEPDLNIEQDVDSYIYDLTEVTDRYEKKATKKFLSQNVLPAIAIYKALLDQRSEEVSLKLMDDYLSLMIKKESRQYRGRGIFDRLIGGYKADLYHEISKRKEGWKLTWLYHSSKETACDIEECLIATVLKEYECEKLTPILCKNEHLLMKKLHANGSFTCKHSIGNGDEFCDFVFEEKL